MEVLLRWRCQECATGKVNPCPVCKNQVHLERWVGFADVATFKSTVTTEFVITQRRLEAPAPAIKKEFREFSKICEMILGMFDDPESEVTERERLMVESYMTRLQDRLFGPPP